MDEKQFNILCGKLDKIMALLAIHSTSEQDKKITILRKAGLNSLEVGNLLGLSESTVRGLKGWKNK